MKLEQFTADSPGRLVPIGGAERAFLPDPLPPAGWEPSRDTLARLAAAREAIGELRGVTSSQLLPRPQAMLASFRSAEARASSEIEGTHAGPEELLVARAAERTPELRAQVGSDAREVGNLERALLESEEAVHSTGLSLWLVRRMHQTLLAGSRGADKDPGRFRMGQVYIGHPPRFVPPPGGDVVQSLMEDLERYWREPGDALDPLARSFLVHYQFETIHPFRDGNGRTGRALLSMMCMQAGRLLHPWLHLSPSFEERRERYFDLLLAVSARGAWDEWVSFCGEAAEAQAVRAASKCRELMMLRERWESTVKQRGLKSQSLSLLDRFLAMEPTTVRDAQNTMDVSYTTARKYLDELETAGIARQLREFRPAMFYAPDVVRIVYGTTD